MADQNNVGSTGEQEVPKPKEEIIKEALRIEQSTMIVAKSHFIYAQFWSAFHLWLGIPTTILAAGVASALIKADKSGVAIFVSTLVPALTAVATFLNPIKKASDHLKAGNAYLALNDKTRIFRTIDCWGADSVNVLTKRLKDLAEEKSKLNRESPQPPAWTYEAAKRGIKKGEADFDVDQNRDLPA
ncbi:MAG: hypothetical protein QOE70_217 [Chthoniobacter sp.]|jgi:hypothetical protein|nr:hypothetical protein [Chthoniobacter sp.]